MGRKRDKRRQGRRRRAALEGATGPAPMTPAPGARWRERFTFVHRRQTVLSFLPLGLRVDARSPEELEYAVAALAARVARDDVEN